MCARIAPTTALIYLGSRYGVPIPPVSQTLGFRAALHTRTEDAVLGDWIDHVRHGDEQGRGWCRRRDRYPSASTGRNASRVEPGW